MADEKRPDSTTNTGGAQEVRPAGLVPNRDTEDMHSGEWAKMQDEAAELAVQLPEALRRVRALLLERFPSADTLAFRGELTLVVAPEQIRDVVSFCRDDERLACELLADLSCVHWPGGKRVENAQETTGWPNYEFEEPGRIDVDYILTSVSRNHRFRVRAQIADQDPEIASVGDIYPSAAWMENEAYDFFGVRFTGHENLRRLHMPETWVGHPLRKDYPLGGVDVQYKGALVPPPDTRKY